jgi:hypothetical protein
MITLENTKAAIGVAQELDNRKIYLAPISGSPLERLSQLGSAAEEVKPGLDYTPDAQEISLVSSLGDDAHGQELDDIAEETARLVQNHLTFAKDVVKPAIVEITEIVADKFKSIDESKTYDIEIVQIDPPEPMIVSSLEDSIRAFNGSPYIPFEGYIPCSKDYTAQEVISWMSTGQADVDEAIVIWSAKKGDAFFESVFKEVFVSPVKGIQFNIDNRQSPDFALALFLISNKLYNNPVDGFNINLSSFNEKMSDIRKACAFRLNQAYSEFERNTNSKLLINNYTAKVVYVNGNIYRQYLEDGGTNAAIFGSVLSSNPKMFLSDIVGNQSDYVSKWEQQNRLFNTALKSRSFLDKKTALRDIVLSNVQQNFTDYFSHLCAEGVTPTLDMQEYQTFLVNLDLFIDNLKEQDLVNVWAICTKAVCDCVFYYTSAGQILNGVEEAIAKNPGIELREALLLSTIEYVTDYVCAQINVSA